MITDLNTVSFSGKQYSYALNAIVQDLAGGGFSIQNENSNILKSVFPEGLIVIGKRVIHELNLTIYALVNPLTGESELGYIPNIEYTETEDTVLDCNNCDTYIKEATPLEKVNQIPYAEYITIKNEDCLNFNINYPVIFEYRVTDCGLNIYFTDDLNQRRFAYLEFNPTLKIKSEFNTIIDYDDCDQPIYSDILDCNKILFNPCFEKPEISLVDVVSIGALKAGSYQFLIAYTDKNGVPLTNYFPATNITPLFTKPISVDTDYNTGSAIVIDINNLDNQTFLYYNLVVAQTINNFTEFKLIGTFSTSYQNNVKHTYTGFEKDLKNLTVNDILFRRPYYDTAKSVTKANNYLFFSGLKEYKQLNLQRAANNVKLYWQTVAIPEAVYSKARNSFYYRTYQRDEVHAFGIVFESCDGWETCAYHIPGNSADYYYNTYQSNPYDIIPPNNLDIIDDTSCADKDLNRRWQVYNMATVIPSLCQYQFTEDCAEKSCWESGDFGYYESEYKYPNNYEVWGDLCNQPIRFHRFPDSAVTHIHDSICGSKHFNESNIVYPIGVRVDHQTVLNALNQAVTDGLITQEDRNKIKGYRIVRANRQGNKSVVAKGLLYDVTSYEKDSKTYYYTNYPYNDLNLDYFLAPDKTTYDQNSWSGGIPTSLPNQKPPIPKVFSFSGRYTFHSPDTHFVNPTLGNILRLETAEYGESEGYFNLADEQAKYKRMTFFSRLIALGMGIAAALSATEEKQCVTYTIRSNSKVHEDKLTNKYDKLKKEEIKQSISGEFVVGTGTITTSNTLQETTFGGYTETDPRINETDYTVCLAQYEFDKKTGKKDSTAQDKIMQAAADEVKACNKLDNDNVVETYTKTTCTGTPHQLLSTATENTIMNILNNGLNVLLTGAPQVIEQVLIGMKEMNIVLDLIQSLIPEKNYNLQYNSVGRYNNYAPVPNNLGIKQRKILKSAYLAPTYQTVADVVATSQYTNSIINNWNRESSVYLQIGTSNNTGLVPPNFINACVWADNSRVTAGNYGMNFSYKETLNTRFNRNISSYYASIKNFLPTQYGKITSIEYLETDSRTFNLSETLPRCSYTVFGGDTFINRFALKRKLPFFTQTRFRQSNGSDVNYSELGNVAFPNYYFDSQKPLFERFTTSSIFIGLLNPLTLLDEVVGLEEARLDVKPVNLFYQKGYIYTYSYGIPYFLVESDINVDYRHGENNLEKDFYPNNANLDEWLQEKNVSISFDNYYFYNKTYSKQNKESFICTFQSNFDPRDCKVKHPNRIIYSETQDTSNSDFDNWRIFKANSYYDFPLSDGNLISADGIESDKVLVRLENVSKIFAAYNLIQTDTESIQVGTGGIFQARPKEFAITDLGYAGTQHRDILHTEYGHIYVDAKRGNIFNLANGGQGLEELGKEGMTQWFKENLQFQLLKDFPNITQSDLDNNFKGIGLTLAFDRRLNRILLTKLDYKRLKNNIQYNPETKEFFILVNNQESIVSLTDKKYFCQKSFTISYNFITKTWVSFHSYKPNYYNSFIDNFESGNSEGAWSHNVINRSYQVFFGALHPFIVEVISQNSVQNNVLNSFEFVLDVLRYNNTYDYFYNQDITFNKAIVYNDRQCSGLLELIKKDENKLTQIVNYPKTLQDRTQILISNSENTWKFNNFYDLHRTNNPMFINSCANDSKEINPLAISYYKPDLDKARIRSRQCRVRLINDIHSNYKFILNFAQNNQTISII